MQCLFDMLPLPKRDLKPDQISPILWLKEGNFAWTVWELPRQFGHVNLLQCPSQKNYRCSVMSSQP